MSFAFVFPGQGSQSVGMMAAYGDAAVVRATFDEASSVLGDDLWAMVADGPAEVLTQTVNTCLLYTSPSPRDRTRSRMPSSA